MLIFLCSSVNLGRGNETRSVLLLNFIEYFFVNIIIIFVHPGCDHSVIVIIVHLGVYNQLFSQIKVHSMHIIYRDTTNCIVSNSYTASGEFGELVYCKISSLYASTCRHGYCVTSEVKILIAVNLHSYIRQDFCFVFH